MCFARFCLHAAPNGADRLGIWGYKHVAPPEQETSIPMTTTFRAKARLSFEQCHHVTIGISRQQAFTKAQTLIVQ